MTRYTLMLFQEAYPEQIRIDKAKTAVGFSVSCWLLNEDKTPHMLLFDGGNFPTEEAVDEMVQDLLGAQLFNE